MPNPKYIWDSCYCKLRLVTLPPPTFSFDTHSQYSRQANLGSLEVSLHTKLYGSSLSGQVVFKFGNIKSTSIILMHCELLNCDNSTRFSVKVQTEFPRV